MFIELGNLTREELIALQATINNAIDNPQSIVTPPRATTYPLSTETSEPVRKRQPGAGRKKGEKTVVVRVPECLVPAITKLIEDHKLVVLDTTRSVHGP